MLDGFSQHYRYTVLKGIVCITTEKRQCQESAWSLRVWPNQSFRSCQPQTIRFALKIAVNYQDRPQDSSKLSSLPSNR